MSNIDNMGATVDLSILHQFISNQNEFIMEVRIQFLFQSHMIKDVRWNKINNEDIKNPQFVYRSLIKQELMSKEVH